ncbi:MAG: P-type conjugative transfer protein VirB9 [Rickettsia endosymbiont of Bryobia graminum]|nr:P-type conjugative transfer protein VirB9 [Rickettsia endosymbiont of Bryobia graminum]
MIDFLDKLKICRRLLETDLGMSERSKIYANNISIVLMRKLTTKLTYLKSFIFIITIFLINPVLAIRESRPMPVDSRMRVMVYNPDDVFKYTGYYGYQANIELAKDEDVVSIHMGDTTSWQIMPTGNRIFIKPMEQDATTNMTIITNKRTYFFELYAAEATDMRDPEMVFNLRFIYPDDEKAGDHLQNYRTASSSTIIDLEHPEKYNFNYSISGNESIAPIKIFDDGIHTYLQFRDKNAEIPAIFAVDEALRESMVNYRLAQDNANMVIIEQVFKKLSIRHGKKIVCVYNEAFKAY